MANYTNPDDENHQDEPQDWLNSALMMARGIGFLLDDNMGVVVNVVGDVELDDVNRVIIWNTDDQITFEEYLGDLPEGSRVIMADFSEN